MLNRTTDRCDACGAEALTLWGRAESTFLFCGHHAFKHGDSLISQGWTLDEDKRDDLVVAS